VYQYPKRTNRIINAVCTILLLLNLAEYALAWARAIYAPLFTPLSLPFIPLLGPFQNTLQTLLIAHIGLLVALVCIRALAFMVPQVRLVDQGLLFKSSLGSRLIRSQSLRDVRSVELPGGRFVVWVHSTQGLPLQGLVGSMLFGEPLWRGFVLTSDLSGFDGIIAQIVGCMKARYAQEDFDAHWKEEPPTWQMRMLNDPNQTIRDMVELEEPPFTFSQAAGKVTWSMLPLALPLLVGGIIHLQIPWWIFVVLILGILEWPLVSGYLSMMPISEKHDMALESALAVYPMTQLTRWVPAVGLALLVAAGVPGPLMLLAALPAVAWGAFPVRELTKVWFEAKGADLWLGVVATVIYQLILYEVLLLMVPR
jgi:hypothetical protein